MRTSSMTSSLIPTPTVLSAVPVRGEERPPVGPRPSMSSARSTPQPLAPTRVADSATIAAEHAPAIEPGPEQPSVVPPPATVSDGVAIPAAPSMPGGPPPNLVPASLLTLSSPVLPPAADEASPGPWKRTADAGESIGKGAASAGESIGKGAAEAGESIGKGATQAGVKTAGFFSRMGRAVARSF